MIRSKTGDSSQKRTAGDQLPSNAARVFFALWYLFGSLVHVKFGLTNNHIYERFGRTSLFAASRELWTTVVMPHIAFFALLLAAFEMAVGILLLSKGRYVKIGLSGERVVQLVPRTVGSRIPGNSGV